MVKGNEKVPYESAKMDELLSNGTFGTQSAIRITVAEYAEQGYNFLLVNETELPVGIEGISFSN